jgi:ubiquinone/menaquinone biosynthesis C-methylase UbiE
MSIDHMWETIHSGRDARWPNGWGKEPESYVIEFARGLDKGSRILDLGTGAGAQAFGMAKLGLTVEGIDGSESAIKSCLDRKVDNTNFVVGDVVSLPYEDNSFDAVVDCVVLQHVASFDNFEKALSEILRVLKPGGLFFSLTASDSYNINIPPRPERTLTEVEVKVLYSCFDDLSFIKTSHVSKKYGLVSWWRIEAKKPLA